MYIYLNVFWHFQYLFPVFRCLFVIGCRCLRATLNISTFVCSDIGLKLRPEIKVIASAVIFRHIVIVSKISGY